MKTIRAAVLELICIIGTVPALASAGVPPPIVDHHQHLLSPRAAEILNNPTRSVDMPAAVTQLLRMHEAAWNTPAELAALYSENAMTLRDFDPMWLRGRDHAVIA